jgi:hypothetical protein
VSPSAFAPGSTRSSRSTERPAYARRSTRKIVPRRARPYRLRLHALAVDPELEDDAVGVVARAVREAEPGEEARAGAEHHVVPDEPTGIAGGRRLEDRRERPAEHGAVEHEPAARAALGGVVELLLEEHLDLLRRMHLGEVAGEALRQLETVPEDERDGHAALA